VQYHYRRYQLEQHAKEQLRHLRSAAIEKARIIKLKNESCIRIQSIYRMHKKVKFFVLQKASVSLLQALWRKKLLLKHLAFLRREEEQRKQLQLDLERAMAKKIIQWFVWKKTFANLHKLSCGLHACLVSIEFKMRQ